MVCYKCKGLTLPMRRFVGSGHDLLLCRKLQITFVRKLELREHGEPSFIAGYSKSMVCHVCMLCVCPDKLQ